MAVEFWLITSIWSYSDDIELCMVSIIVFIVVMVAIINDICGSKAPSCAMSFGRYWKRATPETNYLIR